MDHPSRLSASFLLGDDNARPLMAGLLGELEGSFGEGDLGSATRPIRVIDGRDKLIGPL